MLFTYSSYIPPPPACLSDVFCPFIYCFTELSITLNWVQRNATWIRGGEVEYLFLSLGNQTQKMYNQVFDNFNIQSSKFLFWCWTVELNWDNENTAMERTLIGKIQLNTSLLISTHRKQSKKFPTLQSKSIYGKFNTVKSRCHQKKNNPKLPSVKIREDFEPFSNIQNVTLWL